MLYRRPVTIYRGMCHHSQKMSYGQVWRTRLTWLLLIGSSLHTGNFELTSLHSRFGHHNLKSLILTHEHFRSYIYMRIQFNVHIDISSAFYKHSRLDSGKRLNKKEFRVSVTFTLKHLHCQTDIIQHSGCLGFNILPSRDHCIHCLNCNLLGWSVDQKRQPKALHAGQELLPYRAPYFLTFSVSIYSKTKLVWLWTLQA